MKYIDRVLKLLAAFIVFGTSPAANAGASVSMNAPSGVPVEAAAVGFNTNTFSVGVGTSTPFSSSSVDTNNTQASGYKFYLYDLNDAPVDPPSPNFGSDITFPGDGSIVLSGNRYGSEIATAIAVNSYKNFVGSAYGGGYYIEMIYKQPNVSAVLCASTCSTGGWPVSLAYTIEGSAIFAAGSCALPGFPTAASCNVWPQTGNYGSSFNHQMESDWFENHFGAVAPALHESFGIYNTTCSRRNGQPLNYCQNSTALSRHSVIGMDLTQYHKYGVLLVPATATTGGYIQFYIDDVKQPGSTTWSQYLNNGNSPFVPTSLPNFCGGTAGSTACGTPSWGFGVSDVYHHVPVLGTGVPTSGAPWTMTIQAVNIWQGSPSSNVFNGPAVAATPIFSLASGTYSSPQTLTLSDTTAGALIYYTTNNSTPSQGSMLYTVPIEIGGSQTVKVAAFAPGYSKSAVGTAIYTITSGAFAVPNAPTSLTVR